MGRQAFLTVVLSVAMTTATYLSMHFLVQPRLPVHAVDVPSLSGLSPEQARGILEPRGLLLILDEERPDEHAQPGTLVDQRPLAGSRLRRGEDVHAAVAKAVRVPKLTGMSTEEARAALEQLKLKVGSVAEVSSATAPKGQVVATTPTAGAESRPDGTVDLQVSAGPQAQPVPSVVGKSKSTATTLLEKAGFTVGSLRVGSNDDYDQGVVIRQNPAANATAPPGSKVDLTIND
jgi:beta-lactam-binding protein with PASTA domain